MSRHEFHIKGTGLRFQPNPIFTETVFGHAQFMRWQPKLFRGKTSSMIPLRFGGLTSPQIKVRPLKQKICTK